MSKIYGVVPGKVDSEPDELGRVRVQLDWLGGGNRTYWASIATLMSGRDRGSYFMPEKGDQVLVAFEQGNPEKAYVLGSIWNGVDRPPSTDRRKRMIRSVNGHEIILYDPVIADGDTGSVDINDSNGNQIVLANASITIQSAGTIVLQAPNVIINGRPVAIAPKPI